MNLAGVKATSLGLPEDHPMGLDYSGGPIDPAAIRAAGFLFVLRYLAPLPNQKVISVAERQALHAGGVGVGLVWESYAARCLEGAAVGREDGTSAKLQAAALGFPDGWPIFGAVDMSPSQQQLTVIAAYLEAGGFYPYGNGAVCTYMAARGSAAHAWLMDWGGADYPDSHLHQTGGQVYITGVQCDVNVGSNLDCIWFPPGAAYPVTPSTPAVPAQPPSPTSEEDLMPMLSATDPKNGCHALCDRDTGAVYCYNPDWTPGGHFLGGANRPDWNIGPVVAFEFFDDNNAGWSAYIIMRQAPDGTPHPYSFPSSGVLAH